MYVNAWILLVDLCTDILHLCVLTLNLKLKYAPFNLPICMFAYVFVYVCVTIRICVFVCISRDKVNGWVRKEW